MKDYIVAFVGLPSVGKSTMINSLIGCRLLNSGVCRTTTEAILLKEIFVDDAGNKYRVIDLPGICDAEEKNTDFTELAYSQIVKANLILWVTDDRNAFITTHEANEFLKMVEKLKAASIETDKYYDVKIVITKCWQKYELPTTVKKELVRNARGEILNKSEDTGVSDIIYRVKTNFKDFDVILFNAYGRCAHHKNSSDALRAFVEQYGAHTTNNIGFDITESIEKDDERTNDVKVSNFMLKCDEYDKKPRTVETTALFESYMTRFIDYTECVREKIFNSFNNKWFTKSMTAFYIFIYQKLRVYYTNPSKLFTLLMHLLVDLSTCEDKTLIDTSIQILTKNGLKGIDAYLLEFTDMIRIMSVKSYIKNKEDYDKFLSYFNFNKYNQAYRGVLTSFIEKYTINSKYIIKIFGNGYGYKDLMCYEDLMFDEHISLKFIINDIFKNKINGIIDACYELSKDMCVKRLCDWSKVLNINIKEKLEKNNFNLHILLGYIKSLSQFSDFIHMYECLYENEFYILFKKINFYYFINGCTVKYDQVYPYSGSLQSQGGTLYSQIITGRTPENTTIEKKNFKRFIQTEKYLNSIENLNKKIFSNVEYLPKNFLYIEPIETKELYYLKDKSSLENTDLPENMEELKECVEDIVCDVLEKQNNTNSTESCYESDSSSIDHALNLVDMPTKECYSLKSIRPSLPTLSMGVRPSLPTLTMATLEKPTLQRASLKR